MLSSGKEKEPVSEEKDEEKEPVSGEEDKEDKEKDYVSDEKEDEEKKEINYVFNEGPVCRLSLPTNRHTLSTRVCNYDILTDCCACTHKIQGPGEIFYYHCTTCDVQFHDSCHKWPKKTTHPYHPQHPLILSVLNSEEGVINDCTCRSSYMMKIMAPSSGIPYHGNFLDNCTWCGKELDMESFFYRCSICNFVLDPTCFQKIPLPTISNPKSHHHSLNFLPRPLLHPCDACGSVDKSDPSYICFQCNYVVHESCMDLPRVIKITRHPHQLFYTPFISPTISTCRLCYKTVDIKYGQYSCNHDDCSYVVHSKCATHKNVWDGRELEWEHEEFGETKDVAPFKRVGADLIDYFCHEHHLKLEKYDGVRDAEKQCQACILHIDSRDFYNCLQCEFYLHEVCANLPRKLDHALHHHPLYLDPVPPEDYYSIICSVCSRVSSGFHYKCFESKCCDIRGKAEFQIDVGCILVPDCFTHKSHEHPLFIPIDTGKEISCKGCKAKCKGFYLQCTQCEFTMCYKCATIPDKLRYKYDAVPLSLCYGEVSDETYWCELCEKQLDPSKWFYTCNKPYITIHCSCVFGSSTYMKSGYTFKWWYINFKASTTVHLSVDILRNSSTRSVCNVCHRRCWDFLYFKFSDGLVVCSIDCFKLVIGTDVVKWANNSYELLL